MQEAKLDRITRRWRRFLVAPEVFTGLVSMGV